MAKSTAIIHLKRMSSHDNVKVVVNTSHKMIYSIKASFQKQTAVMTCNRIKYNMTKII